MMLLTGFSKCLRPRSFFLFFFFELISEQVLLYPPNKKINSSSKSDGVKMHELQWTIGVEVGATSGDQVGGPKFKNAPH